MFYKLKVAIFKLAFLKRIVRGFLSKVGKCNSSIDPNADLIKKYVEGRSFADIGCMWGVNGRYSFLAEEYGAESVKAVDIYPASEEFVREKKNRNSAVDFIQGDFNRQEIIDRIGSCDVVFASGVLYHMPDPFSFLYRLRLICNDVLILQTQTIPEMHGMKNVGVFFPYLDERQRRIWKQGMGMQKAITGPYEPESGYGNWFWGLTPSCVESLLQCAGFKVEERQIRPFNAYFICRTRPIQFFPCSGEWITREDEAFLKFKP
jgi:SAM-dependent methyltransferase